MGVPKSTYGQDASFAVTSDLSGSQFLGVKVSSGVLTTTHTKGNAIIGILQDKPKGNVDPDVGRVRGFGFTRVKLGGAVSEMDQLVVDTDGYIITDDTANQFVIGIALEDGDDNDIIGCLLTMSPTLTA